MKKDKISVSVIIVNYKAENELFDCIDSIMKSSLKTGLEIIVVDNDENSKIKNVLKNRFPKVRYVKSPNNKGYGGGNNLGANKALGEYLFFLNPDTLIKEKAIEVLYEYIRNKNNIGIVSPLLVDTRLKPFKTQSKKEITPLNAIYSFSLLRYVFPTKSIYNDPFFKKWDKISPFKTDTVPGGAMMIKKDLFKKIGGFDENFFLYFEENDISKRIISLGYELHIVPEAKIVHLVGKSTESLSDTRKIYAKSRYLYLKKHYGLLKAMFVQAIISINKTTISLFTVLVLAFILRILNLDKTMPFIGDQGWFYLSARDMLTKGVVPLVGIASSHPWLHQGPLWTYLLVLALWLGGFNPINGAYLTIALGLISVLSVYILGKEIFSRRTGMISALLYATSPLIILYSRTPYHTSPIPLFTVFYILSLYKFVKGNRNYFPLSIFFLAILYSFELATTTLWFFLFIILAYGLLKKKDWFRKLLNKRTIVFSLIAFLIPMLPVLIYDFKHNFPQTLGFMAWLGYRALRLFGFPAIHTEANSLGFDSLLTFSFHFIQNIVFASSGIIALTILLLSISMLIYEFFKEKIRRTGPLLLILWLIISFAGYFINQTSSEAYLPIIFPALIYLVAFSLDKLMHSKIFFIPAIILTVFIVLLNSHYAVLSDYSLKEITYSERLSVAKAIVKIADGNNYNITGVGPGSQFTSFTMNYEYLTWWLGHAPSKFPQKLKLIIHENNDKIFLTE